MRTLLFAVALATVAAAVQVAVAAAQDAEPTCREVRPGFLQCEEERIFGRQPQSFVLLGRTRDRWEAPPLVRRDAARDVVRSVRRDPF